MKERLGQDFFDGQSERRIEVSITDDGRPVVHAGDPWYFQDSTNGELVAGHRDEMGRTEFGGIDYGRHDPVGGSSEASPIVKSPPHGKQAVKARSAARRHRVNTRAALFTRWTGSGHD